MAKLELSGISKLGGYLLSNRGPLDKRTVVPEYSNLNDLVTDYYIYPGIIVYVQAEDKHYKYALNPTYIESPDNPNEDGKYIWKEFNGTEVEPIIAELEGRITTITYTITEAKTEVDFKYGLPGMTKVDWGDGAVNTELSHTYTEVGEYKCRIYDLTEICLAVYGPSENWSKGVSCITAITLGKTVTSIKGLYQTPITEIVIPDSVITISTEAFRDCYRLTSVVIGGSVTSISDLAFYYCYNLMSVVIGDGVTTIGEWAFSGCDNLKSVIIPNSVTTIGNSAFRGCSSLKSVVIPDSVTSIGISAFYNCSSLTSVSIGDGVIYIEEEAFYNCNGLTSVVIGNSVKWIGECAFSSCNSLTSVVIPNSVTYIYLGAFSHCSSLTSVIIGNSVQTIEAAVFNACTSLTSIEIPDSVTSIGSTAFGGCSGLRDVVIGRGIKTISAVGSGELAGCTNLQTITFKNTEVTEVINFSDCPVTEIYVPYGCVDKYKKTWMTANVPQKFIDLISTKGNFCDLVVGWDTMLVLDGGNADVQLAVLDKTILK